MKTVKCYNKLQGRNKILGLEFFDLLLLLSVYLIVFVFSSHLFINLVLVLSAYLVLRIYKRGKAPHWTGSVVRFLFRPKRFRISKETESELFER